jgi:hypothetical protein
VTCRAVNSSKLIFGRLGSRTIGDRCKGSNRNRSVFFEKESLEFAKQRVLEFALRAYGLNRTLIGSVYCNA